MFGALLDDVDFVVEDLLLCVFDLFLDGFVEFIDLCAQLCSVVLFLLLPQKSARADEAECFR